ncbi:MAG: exosortase/archaeosortase family protein [Maioricimonas sp. JB045]|uniref:exosortase/archaeosortase family protein n=1 Tax=Maioricimonas sp. JC845 TaxID=3232138 RepID=UPI00345A4D88
MHQHRTRIIVLCAFFIGLTVWSYWTTLAVMADLWSRKPEYSHGWIVPLLALYLLWEGIKGLQKDRRMPPEEAFTPSLWGIPLLAIAIGLRVFAAHYYMEWFDFLSIIPFVAGLTLLIGGWGAFRVAWAPIAYLFFMLPLPYTAEVMLRGPLREVGTVASTYAMQTLGLPAFAEGTVVVVNDVRIGVVEACSGLRMLMIFFALSTAVALLCRRPMWQRLLIVLSAAPIALIANITRITATGLLYALGYDHLAEVVFHDLAGWLMMPFALVLLGAEVWFLDNLFIVEKKVPLAVGLKDSSQTPPAGQPAT